MYGVALSQVSKSPSYVRWPTLPSLDVARMMSSFVWMPDRENKLPDRGRAYVMGGIHDYGDVTATVEVLDFYYDAVKEEWINQ